MSKLHIISSIQDSLGTNLRTIVSIIHSETTTRFRYTVYNDFSSHETTSRLQSHTATEFYVGKPARYHTVPFIPLHVSTSGSATENAGRDGIHLLIVESDAILEKDTVHKIYRKQRANGLYAETASENRIRPYCKL